MMISTTTTIVVMWLVVPVLCKVNRIYITRSRLGVRSIDRFTHQIMGGSVCVCNTCGHVYDNISMYEPAHKRITPHQSSSLDHEPYREDRTGIHSASLLSYRYSIWTESRLTLALGTYKVQGRVQEEQPRSCYMYLYYT